MTKSTKILFFLIFFTNLIFNSSAEIVNDLKLNGNFRIKDETIKEKVGFVKKNYTEFDLNNIQKKIYETGFFKKVNISIEKNILIVKVVENPIVNFFLIEGENDKKFLEYIYDNIKLGPNKIFSESKLVDDFEKIKYIYRSEGYYNLEIDPKLSLLKDNSVNLVINLKKNSQSKIKKIFFIGEKVFKSSDLIDEISSLENGWFRFSSNTTLNESRVNYDKFLLKRFYLNQGYFDVQITSANISFNPDNTANITFSINAGSLYKINQINIVQDKKLLNDEDILRINEIARNELKLKRYSLQEILKIKEKIYKYLAINNYENIEFVINEIKNDALKAKDTIKVDILFKFKKKEIVNNIIIKGNSLTDESVIRNKIIFSEGDYYNDYKKDKSVDYLKSSGIFKSVSLKEVKKDNDTVDLLIDVVEQPTGSIYGGASVGTLESSVSFGITENNFLGQGKKLNSTVSLGTQKINYDITYLDDNYKSTNNALKIRAYILDSKYKNTGYESTNIGNEISSTYYPFEKIGFTVGGGIDLDDVKSASNSKLNGSYQTVKTFYGLSKDTRNKTFNPTEGSKYGFVQTIAIPGSDIQYLKNSIYNSSYFDVSKNYIVNFKAGASSINSLNNKDIKLSDRLYVPVSNLKGFQSRSIGPIDSGDFIGGNYSAYGNISSTFPNPLPESLNARTSIFLDAANVWGVDYDSSLDSDKIRSSYGVALDWFSPIGPMSFIFSNVLSKSSSDKEESFSFQIGSAF